MRYLLLSFITSIALASCGVDDPPIDNADPDLRLDVAPTLEYVIGEGLVTIAATAEDADGHEVTIGVVDPPARADFQSTGGWAVFRWDPLASDITSPNQPLNLVFYAEDNFGGRTERVVSLSIRAGNGTPFFENSPSVLYNTDSGKPLIFEVRVRDTDSQRLAIAMPTELAPDGAKYIPTGDKTGKFEWEPNEQQLQFRVHSVTFTADDGENETVTQKVSILFKKSSGAGEEPRPDVPDNPTDPTNCSYEDRIRHTALGAQHGPDAYRIEARLAGDAVGRFDRLVLNWSSQDAYNMTDVQLEGSEMTEEAGVFVGIIENPLLPPGQSVEYYYEICAIDDDSSEDDSVMCGPSSIYHSFIAYSPGEQDCADDAFFNSSFDAALDLEGVLGWEHHRVCTGTQDFFRMDLQAMQDADLFVTFPFGSNVNVEMFDENQSPLPLELSDCSGFGYAFVENETDQPTTRYFRVSGSDAPYQVSPFFFEPVSSCVATDIEPNENTLQAASIATDGRSTPLQEICGGNDFDVFEFNASAGDQITANALFTHDDGDIDIKLFKPSGAPDVPNGMAAAASLGISDNERIEYTAEESGVHYLVVRGYGDSNTYTLDVDVAAGMTCTDDDQFANNHDMSSPAQLGLETISDLKLCDNTLDYFSFLAFDGELLTVTLRVTSGDIANVTIQSILNGSPEAMGVRNGDKITIDVFSFDVNEYLLEIESSSPVTYELTLSLTI